jgi:hypothetical protein
MKAALNSLEMVTTERLIQILDVLDLVLKELDGHDDTGNNKVEAIVDLCARLR